MNRALRVGAFALSLLLLHESAPAQAVLGYSDTEFWLSVPQHGPLDSVANREVRFSLAITAETDGQATVSIPGVGFSEVVDIIGGSAAIQLPAGAEIDGVDSVQANAVRVSATVPVTVRFYSILVDGEEIPVDETCPEFESCTCVKEPPSLPSDKFRECPSQEE